MTSIAERAPDVPSRARRGPAGRGLRPLLTVWGAWLLLMAGANVPAPLYAVYAERFGFSSAVLTVVFATYAFVLVPALMLFGQLSDRFGRRLVIVAGLAVAVLALLVFALARGTAWLFVARALQGLAVGMISSAATAALVELEPRADARRPALLAGLAQAGGSAAGPLVGGVLAQWAPSPLRLPYVVMLAATVAAAALVMAIPEPAGTGAGAWRVTRPNVPAEIVVPFVRLGITAAALWATLALYLSIVPSYTAVLLGTSNLALIAAVSALACAASCTAQIVAHQGIDGRVAQAVGLAVLAAGLVLLVLAAPVASLAVLLAGAVLAGAGHGIGFLYAQDELNRIAPPERRGEVTAAFITCIYAGVATSVIAVGLLDLRVSLSTGVGVVAAMLAATSAATAVWHWRAAQQAR
jgi:predicted MFS family arabinose efflux permease